MKLITKTSYFYLITSIILFSAASAIFYFYISVKLDEDISEDIEINKNTILDYVAANQVLPPISPMAQDYVSFVPVTEIVYQQISDTMLLGPEKDEYLPYRQVIFPVNLKGQHYKAVVQKPLFQKDDLLETFALSLTFFTVCLVLILFLLSRWLSVRMWKPFYGILGQLSTIELNTNDSFPLQDTSTDEFKQLHQEISKMSMRIRDQYRNLKEFSENASHEIQTPLAIIRNKLELLMQSGKFSEEELKWIHDAFESANRLSKLTQSLLLLSKIENRQYPQTENISLQSLIRNKLNHFDDIRSIRNLEVSFNVIADVTLDINPHLADILISNIISNAFKHSPENGQIEIELSPQLFVSTNTGKPLSKDPASLFNRFNKDSDSSESSGLGLSIVQEICHIYQFTVDYQFINGWHKIAVHF